MRFQRHLHLPRVHLHAAGDDHLLDAAIDDELPSRLIEPAEVAGAEPAVLFQECRRDLRATELDFAVLGESEIACDVPSPLSVVPYRTSGARPNTSSACLATARLSGADPLMHSLSRLPDLPSRRWYMVGTANSTVPFSVAAISSSGSKRGSRWSDEPAISVAWSPPSPCWWNSGSACTSTS